MATGIGGSRTLSMDDAEPDVQVKRLYTAGPGKAFTVLVRFPAGWRRIPAGHYEADEEVLFVEGSFEMSGQTYGAGSYAYFPERYLREASRSPGGALAIARFGGSADWIRGAASEDSAAQPVMVAEWTAVAKRRSPLAGGGDGRMLRRHQLGETWMLDQVPTGVAPHVLELFSLADRQWIRLEAGEPIPDISGPVYSRILSAV